MRVEKNLLKFSALATALLCICFMPESFASSPIRSNVEESSFRVRATGLGLIYRINDSSLYAAGPEVTLEKIFSQKWSFAGGLGQAYIYDLGIKTISTSIDVAVWLSVIGQFSHYKQSWLDSDGVFVTYRRRSPSGLRIGFGTQQLLLNEAGGAIPFSGFSLKMMYEFGLSIGVDFAATVDVSHLTNQNFKMSSLRAGISSIVSL